MFIVAARKLHTPERRPRIRPNVLRCVRKKTTLGRGLCQSECMLRRDLRAWNGFLFVGRASLVSCRIADTRQSDVSAQSQSDKNLMYRLDRYSARVRRVV